MLAPLLLLTAAAVLVLMFPAQMAECYAARHQADHVWISLDSQHQRTSSNTAWHQACSSQADTC